MANQQDISIPPEIAEVYSDSIKALPAEDSAQAHEMAMRMVRHAGWYQTSNGWRQLGPDVREKVNIRKAEPQPDQTYLIQDVDVFYPNAVKGQDQQFDGERNNRIIENTNKATLNGGQKPGLTKIHPSPFSKMAGTFIASFGHAFNFRPSPRGNGWIRCDLADVPADVFNEWKTRRITGLSAGIVEDSVGMNERIGHIAMLGGESQALSHLPITEIYSTENQICFSAEIIERNNMPDKKKFFSSMKDCYSKYASAFAAFESGEPTADDKLKEAKGSEESVAKEFPQEYAAGGAAGNARMWKKVDEAGPGHRSKKSGEYKDMDGMWAAEENAPMPPKKEEFDASGEGRVDVDPKLKPTGSPAIEPVVPNGNTGAFAATEREKALEEKLRIMQLQQLAIIGKQAQMEFSAFTKQLTADGHQFDLEWATKSFEANLNNKAALDLLYEGLRKSPKRIDPSQVTVFGADGQTIPNVKPNGQEDEKAVLQTLRNAMPGATFSAEHLKLGLLMANALNTPKN